MIARAHEQFRWFGGGWKVNAELPSTAGFAAASQFVRADDIAEHISCGPDLDTHVAAARPFAEARHVGVCPGCGGSSARVYSRYQHQLADAPVVVGRWDTVALVKPLPETLQPTPGAGAEVFRMPAR